LKIISHHQHLQEIGGSVLRMKFSRKNHQLLAGVNLFYSTTRSCLRRRNQRSAAQWQANRK